MSIAVEINDVRATGRFYVPPPTWSGRVESAAMRAAGRACVALRATFGSRNGGRLGLVTYHRVAEHVSGLPAPLHNVTPKRFREQIEGLLARGWTFCSLSRALEAAAGGAPLPAKSAVITFDDGFASVHESAWPVLRANGVPFTLFLCTAYLDRSTPFPFDLWGLEHAGSAPLSSYRPLTTEECREMCESDLCELGAHTHTHEDFRGRPDEFREDLAQNVAHLQTRFGQESPAFAFPYGSQRLGFNAPDLVAAARGVGVRCGLSTRSSLVEPGADPFNWGRFNAFSWDDSATLDGKLHGWYGWMWTMRKSLGLGWRGERSSVHKGPK